MSREIRGGVPARRPENGTRRFTSIAAVQPPNAEPDWIALTGEPLPVEDATTWATTAASGAVVTFCGVVRDHAEGRPG